jgi:hypothetical protein
VSESPLDTHRFQRAGIHHHRHSINAWGDEFPHAGNDAYPGILEDISALKIHLDADLGGDIDDICALTMLLRWPREIRINGVTTVGEINGRRAGQVKSSWLTL